MTLDGHNHMANSGAAESFIRKLRDYPVLDREEEHRLAILYRETGDPAAARKLVEGHLRLVVKIARSCCFRASVLPDLIQEGSLGLMKAVTKYDPDRGVRLSTYASWWIRAYIYQYTITNARVIRLVTTFPQRRLFFALPREQAKVSADGEAIEPSVLAKRLGVSVKDVVEMQERLGARDVQLDTTALDHSGTGNYLTEDRAAPDEALAAREMRRAVTLKMEVLEKSLCEREKLILKQRLTAEEPMTLQEVGRRCGISRERARQLENRLKKRLHPHLVPLREAEERPSAA